MVILANSWLAACSVCRRQPTTQQPLHASELTKVVLLKVPVKCINGRLCVRISAHIYNDLSQYKTLAETVASAMMRHV